MKIAIIGAGWLGLPLAEYWQNAGHQITATTTSEEKLARLLESEFEAKLWTLGDNFPDWILEFEAIIFTVPPRPNPQEFENRAKSFFTELNKRQYTGRLLFCSSSSVLGKQSGTLDEATTPIPETASALSLNEIEKFLESLSFSTTVFRLGGLYGNQRHPVRTLAQKKESLSLGRAPVNLVHLDEVIKTFDSWLGMDLKGFQLFHLVNDIEASKSQFYPLCAKLFNLSPPLYGETGESDTNLGKKLCNGKIKDVLNITFRSCPLI